MIQDLIHEGQENLTRGETLSDDFYSKFMDPDQLMSSWTLTATPIPSVSIIALYLLFILKIGPQLMADRKPYELKNALRIYNIFQVLFNLAIIYDHFIPVHGIYPLPFLVEVSCKIPDHVPGMEELKYTYLMGCWKVLILKMIDFVDTVFMVLRKRNRQITFLHIYHHIAMVFSLWFTVRYIKAVHGVFPMFINLFIHTIMYSYYFMATIPFLRKYLWWKKYLTTLQMVQFVVITIYLGLIYYNSCPISPRFTAIWVFNMVMNFVLFSRFYMKNYINTSSTHEVKKKSS